MFSGLSMEIQWMFSGFSLSKVGPVVLFFRYEYLLNPSFIISQVYPKYIPHVLWPQGYQEAGGWLVPRVDPPFFFVEISEPHSNAIKSHSTTLKSHEVPLNHQKPLKSYLSSIVFPNRSTHFFPGRLCKRPLGRLRPLGWLRPAGSAGEVLRSGRADFNDENIAWYIYIYGKWHI